DFVWRTGAANTPDYYIDSLPPTLETGRGSPVGLEFYDHTAFPEKYRGAYFMADWAIGVIYAVHLKRDGASYKATAEKFCTGAPMNVTDLAVGPDGALYFTLGGRGTQGGIYRIVSTQPQVKKTEKEEAAARLHEALFNPPQPLAAWSRAQQAALAARLDSDPTPDFARAAQDGRNPARSRIKALDYFQRFNRKAEAAKKLLTFLAKDKAPEVRAHAVWWLGIQGNADGKDTLVKALKDDEAFVRRRACEALIRAGIEPPVDAVWPLLAGEDRFLRTAARLVLQRIDPKKWADRIAKEEKDLVAYEAIVALCKTDKAAPYAEAIFARLKAAPKGSEQRLLDYLRTVQLALIHAGTKPELVRGIAEGCDALFPRKEWRADRELAILLTHFRREKVLEKPVHARLLDELLKTKGGRQQQIHYFYCLRLLHDGWTPEQKQRLLAWYEGTRTWTGGHSFTPFLENILRDLRPIFTPEDRGAVIAKGEQMPGAAAVLLRMTPEGEVPPARELAGLYTRLLGARPGPGVNDLKELLVSLIGRRGESPEAQEALRTIAGKDPSRREAVARALLRSPSAANWPFLVSGLQSSQPGLLLELIQALPKAGVKPKPDDPAPFRAVLVASTKLRPNDRWKAVELLRFWTGGKQFGADDGDWKGELGNWSKWFVQNFPKEPALPDVASDRPPESKYRYAELLAFLEKDPAGRGDASRGRAVFEKAQCIKCHKFGKEGEGIGPDLTTLKSRFKRVDVLESIYYPSKVISDQYRSTTIVLKSGKQLTGLAAPQGDTVTVLQSDGTKVTIKKDDIEQQFASLVSVMPEKLLDPLTKQEIADLFAYLETEPK
ncbi:MAG TPA: HEAT repeat domain-containing protein, partial [Gemmataceae bacterium]|nr:HEAT repeat domain-containing protein [Gemmataceae bacterium]